MVNACYSVNKDTIKMNMIILARLVWRFVKRVMEEQKMIVPLVSLGHI